MPRRIKASTPSCVPGSVGQPTTGPVAPVRAGPRRRRCATAELTATTVRCLTGSVLLGQHLRGRMTNPHQSEPRAADIERGTSLPASWYTEADVAARERERIFRRSWQYVGRAEEVARTGDFFTASVGDVPVVVVRNDEALRAFVNVCRHRRHEVVSGSGNRKVLQCPYHAWTYGLDGCLLRRAALRSGTGIRPSRACRSSPCVSTRGRRSSS